MLPSKMETTSLCLRAFYSSRFSASLGSDPSFSTTYTFSNFHSNNTSSDLPKTNSSPGLVITRREHDDYDAFLREQLEHFYLKQGIGIHGSFPSSGNLLGGGGTMAASGNNNGSGKKGSTTSSFINNVRVDKRELTAKGELDENRTSIRYKDNEVTENAMVTVVYSNIWPKSHGKDYVQDHYLGLFQKEGESSIFSKTLTTALKAPNRQGISKTTVIIDNAKKVDGTPGIQRGTDGLRSLSSTQLEDAEFTPAPHLDKDVTGSLVRTMIEDFKDKNLQSC